MSDNEDSVELAKTSQVQVEADDDADQESSSHFKSFKEYKDRKCVDWFCCFLLTLMFLGWIVILILSAMNGNPQVLYRATDYKGNICGSSLAPTDTEGTPYAEDKGNFPKNLKDAKYGVMPRMVDDFVAQLARTSKDMTLTMPVITTMCAESCPKSGTVFCNYEFLDKMSAAAGTKWATNPLPEVPATEVKTALQLTSSVNRALVFFNPAAELQVTQACLSAQSKPSGYAGSAFDFCQEVFYQCDKIIVDTKKLLGRCVPNFPAKQENSAARCIEPLSNVNCTTGSEFDVNCVENEKGISNNNRPGKRTIYKPARLANGDYTFEDTEAKKLCRKIENRVNVLSENIPQLSLTQSVTNAAMSFSNYVAAVQKAWLQTMLCGLFLPMLVGFAFLIVIRWCAGCIVWVSIIILEGCFIAGSIVFLHKSGVITLPGDYIADEAKSTLAIVSTDQRRYYQIAGWVFTLLAVVFFCTILFLRKNIVDAVRIIRISAMAVASNAFIMLWPLVSFLFIGIFSAGFCIIGVLLLSSGKNTISKLAGELNGTKIIATPQNSTFTSDLADIAVRQSDEIMKYLGFFNLFMWLWMCQFVQAVGIFTIGGAVAEWYFTDKSKPARKGEENEKCCARLQNNGGVCGAFCATMKFHTGTAAFGSLILTIVKLAKWWLAYLAMEIKKANPNNRIVKCLACCIMRCVDCFESCLRYLSKNAYLYSTIKGTNFCVSSYKSFVMLWNNFGRFGATGISSEIVMLFGKLSIMMFSTLAVYYAVEFNSDFQDIESENYISSMGQFVITIVVLFMSYIVAEIFFDVYDIATDSIMLCYCFDAEDGNGEAFAARMGDELEFKKTKQEDPHEGDGYKCCGFGCCCSGGAK